MELIDQKIQAADGTKFPAATTPPARVAQYEQLRQRLENLTGPSAGGDYPRPIGMLCLDPFGLDEVDAMERILWAQEVLNLWRDVADWKRWAHGPVGDQEACEEIHDPGPGLAVAPMPMESWKWTDPRIDGAATRVEEPREETEEAQLVREVREATRELPEPVRDADGQAARASGFQGTVPDFLAQGPRVRRSA